ncbi:MAG: DUF1254 domain-containing protein [Polyangiales bacterium]
MKRVASWLLASLLAGCVGTHGSKEIFSESYAPPPASILTPDLLRTRIGTLDFFDGLPDGQTVETVYDHLDFIRGVRAFLRTIPGASMVAMRKGLYDAGALPNYTVLLTESSMDSRSLFLTPSTEAVYATAWIDLKGGPIVVETPPYVEGALFDFWGRRLTDTGKDGPDRGRGGMYVAVPPGYGGFVPRSQFAVQSATYGVWAVFRGPLIDGRPEPAVGSFKKYLKIYPLQEAQRPPPNPFVDISGMVVHTIPPIDASYFEQVDTLVQEEPADSQDPEVLGLLASIGIIKDKRFSPDGRMRAILADAAAVGDTTARAMLFAPRDDHVLLYSDRHWQRLLVGGDPSFIRDGARLFDAMVRFHYLAAADTMAAGPNQPGSATESAIAFRDSKGRLLDGSRSYVLTLPPSVPAKDLWSIVVYDNQTRSMLQTDQRFPSKSSVRGGLRPNQDGSVSIYFGPAPPRLRQQRPNWIQTVPGKGWNAMLRLHGAEQTFFDQTWRPGDIELIPDIAPAKPSRKPPKMRTDIPASLSTPDHVDTRIGTLDLVDGVPTAQTIDRLYDNLDFIRGVDAFLHTISGASLVAMRRGLRGIGVDRNGVVAIFDRLMDSHSLFLTGNTESVYTGTWLDLHAGAMVVESPPDTPGVLDDFFFRHVADLGKAGPDAGAGGLFLFVPPKYEGQLSERYFIFKTPTYGNLLMWRGFPVEGDPARTAEALKETIHIYPFDVPLLEDLGLDTEGSAAEPAKEEPTSEEEEAPTRFVSVSGMSFNTIPSSDFGFYEEIDVLAQEEPPEALGPEILGLLATVGIEHGTRFAPDPRMKAILVEAAAVANATARALAFRPRDVSAYLYDGSAWYSPFLGGSHEFLREGARQLDARSMFFSLATMTSPAMVHEQVGVGSQYGFAATDAEGNYLDGAGSYRLVLPKDVPAKDFWSIAVYDPQTRSMLQTPRTATPSLNSKRGEMAPNEDGSITIYFGPEPPAGKERNWIQTVPGKGWFAILRLYGPLDAWFDKTWRPGEIELFDSVVQ